MWSIFRADASESLMLSGNWNPQISQMPADIRVSHAARSLALPLAPAFLSHGRFGVHCAMNLSLFADLSPGAAIYPRATGWNRKRGRSRFSNGINRLDKVSKASLHER